MSYIKILLSIPLLLIALLGVIMTFASPFDIFNVIVTLIFLVPGYVLASKGIKEIKVRKDEIVNEGNQQQAEAVDQVSADEIIEVKTEPERQSNLTPKYSDQEVLEYVQSLSGFPEIDDKGMKILKILEDVRLSGVTREYEGMNPQETIEMLSEGEEVFFKRIPMKKYPNAILVIDISDNPIGWIPEDFYYQEDISQRLDDGTTVKGRVSTILGGEEGKSYGIRIDIARYTKKREKK